MVAHWNYASIPPAVLDPASKMQATSQTGGLAFEDLISESACGYVSAFLVIITAFHLQNEWLKMIVYVQSRF